MSDEAVESVLAFVADGKKASKIKKSLYLVGGQKVHTRFKSKPSAGLKFPFNINPATLSADYELWVCGTSDTWYLMPTLLMQQIYDHPDGYIDKRHPDIRIVTVDVESHQITYALGGEKMSAQIYFCASLPGGETA